MALPEQALDCTRLAPSPTGALHLGNARTFLLTWALARRRGWRAILRVEDLDTPRVKPGTIDALIDTLVWLGLDWDEPDPTRGAARRSPRGGYFLQSAELEPYRGAMRSLAARGLAYPCALSRSEIEAAASAPQEGAHDVPFPRMLRPADAATPHDFDAEQARAGPEGTNWRLIVEPGETAVDDRFAGRRGFDVGSIVGDFVLWTKRGTPSYQLAVVVDDARQGVTEVVRGDDLLDSAARQTLLYRALGLTDALPAYTHLPLVIGADGRRLAKRHGDTRLDFYRARGVPAEAVIGLIASWGGVTGREGGPPGLLSAAEFARSVDLSTVPSGPVTFTPEHDAWLLSHSQPG